MPELERLYAYRGDEPTAYPTLTLEVRGLADPPHGLACLREIMRGVLAVPAPLWHEDAAPDWVAYLPAWFVDSMRRFTPAELLARPEQWEYASWVATLVDRQWEWWGAEAGTDGRLRVTLIGFELTCNFEPLAYALRVSCGLDGSARSWLSEQL